jgi:hypothetical protein
MRQLYLWLLAIVCLLGSYDTAVAQLSLPKQTQASFSGQVRDVDSGEPLTEVVISIRTEYGDVQTKTDSSGYFSLEVNDEQQLKSFLIILSHPNYREKDFTGLVMGGLEKTRISLRTEGGRLQAKVKGEKDLSVDCGNTGQISNKSVQLTLDCQPDKRALTLAFAKNNSFTIFTTSDLEAQIKKDGIRLEPAANTALKFELQVTMFRR